MPLPATKTKPLAEEFTSEPTPKRWRMPIPRLGMVRWRYHQPHASKSGGVDFSAIITACNGDTLDLIVFTSGYHLPQAKVGARHIDDPGLKGMSQPNPGGVWDLLPLERDIGQLLEDRLGGPSE